MTKTFTPGVYEPASHYDDGWPVCSECGDEFPEIDEATELCDGCFEHIFGEIPDNEAALASKEDGRS